MSRPEVSVVMPFGGPDEHISSALDSLRLLDIGPGDELILADNSSRQFRSRVVGVEPDDSAERRPPVTVVPVPGERSPAHARNVGAARASAEWILFLDADCRPNDGLLEAYFRCPIDEDVGALAGQLAPILSGQSLAARYGAARNFLDQAAHARHPYLPRAAAANLLVRRRAFEQIGGFYEGLRAGEDTDFSWRLQQAGWRLELRSEAWAGHRYRGSLRELRRQWRGYAAGRGWLSRRYEGFRPEPAVLRALRRAVGRGPARSASTAPFAGGTRAERGSFLALDAVLALEELAGLLVSNRPSHDRSAPADVVLVADRFPAARDPLVDLARTLGRTRVEAVARPDVVDVDAVRRLDISYLEDEGALARLAAALRLSFRHPARVLEDMARRRPGEPSTWALAPAVLRLERDPAARIHPLGSGGARRTAARLARLAGRRLDG